MATQAELETRIAELEAAQAKAETLYRIGRDLNVAQDTDELLHILARPAVQAGAATASLLYVDANQAGRPEWAETVATWQKEGATQPNMRYRLSEFPFTSLFINNPDKPQLVSDITTDERVDENVRGAMAQMGLHALVIVPLTQAGLGRETSAERTSREHLIERRWVGLLIFSWTQPREFGPQEAEIYQALIGLASPAVDSRRLVDSLEHMVKERTSELVESRQMLHTVLNSIPLRVFWKDRDLNYLGCSQLFAQDAGFDSPQEIVGKNDFDMVWTEQAALYQADDRLVIDSDQPKLGYEEPLTTPDGTQTWIRTSKVPLRDAEGNVTGLLGMYDDISAIKQAELERQRLQQQIIKAQQQTLQELSTPIIPVMERIIVMPLVGDIDTQRAKDIMRALLTGIRQYRAKIVILDITGVPIVDSGVAAHLDKTIQAARLKGARTIITGVSDAVAEAIVDLGIDWSAIQILSDLQTGLVVALDRMGVELSKRQ
jgi:rsbT co-antagonist protein RsbR